MVKAAHLVRNRHIKHSTITFIHSKDFIQNWKLHTITAWYFYDFISWPPIMRLCYQALHLCLNLTHNHVADITEATWNMIYCVMDPSAANYVSLWVATCTHSSFLYISYMSVSDCVRVKKEAYFLKIIKACQFILVYLFVELRSRTRHTWVKKYILIKGFTGQLCPDTTLFG